MPRGRPSRATVYSRLDAVIDELHNRLGGLPSPEEADFAPSKALDWVCQLHEELTLKFGDGSLDV